MKLVIVTSKNSIQLQKKCERVDIFCSIIKFNSKNKGRKGRGEGVLKGEFKNKMKPISHTSISEIEMTDWYRKVRAVRWGWTEF